MRLITAFIVTVCALNVSNAQENPYENIVMRGHPPMDVVEGDDKTRTLPKEIAHGIAPDHPRQPQVSVDANGGIHLVYGTARSIYYCKSTDRGANFTTPIELPNSTVVSLGMRRGPRIAATVNSICVTFVGGKQGMGRDGDVLAIHSQDGGVTWEGPVAVNEVNGSAREGLHGMAAESAGRIGCVWLDLRNRQSEIMASFSTNGGKTWGPNVLVYHSPDGSVCECCHPSICFDSEGIVSVLWRNAWGGARDMYVATSADGGESFGPALKLGDGTWPLNACPMDGGGIAATGPNRFATVWRREFSVYLTTSDQQEERRLGDGEQPWIASSSDGPFVIWLKKRGDAALLLRPNRADPEELAKHAIDPVVAANSVDGGPVVAAWESVAGQSHSIQCLVLGSVK